MSRKVLSFLMHFRHAFIHVGRVPNLFIVEDLDVLILLPLKYQDDRHARLHLVLCNAGDQIKDTASRAPPTALDVHTSLVSEKPSARNWFIGRGSANATAAELGSRLCRITSGRWSWACSLLETRGDGCFLAKGVMFIGFREMVSVLP